jgi:hypothetical protein
MSDYTKSTNFAAKDSLTTGDPNKVVKGTEIDDEFNAIASAVSSKADEASPTFTGTPVAPTAASGTNTTQIATTAFVTTAVSNGISGAGLGTIATQNANNVSITGGSITGITDLAVADGGTGASTLAANAVILGNGTSSVQTVSPSSSGNVLTSNGTTWVSAAPSVLSGGQVFTSNGTFTIPSGVTAVKVTVIGGGGSGAGGLVGDPTYFASGGGGGGSAIKYLTSLTSGNTLSITIGSGAASVSGGGSGSGGGTSSVASGTQSITTISATGGGAGLVGTSSIASGGSGGLGSNGDLNIKGGGGGVANNSSGSGAGGSSILGGGGRGVGGGGATQGENGGAYGGGGSGSFNGTSGAGASGVVIFEW